MVWSKSGNEIHADNVVRVSHQSGVRSLPPLATTMTSARRGGTPGRCPAAAGATPRH